jgi:hypothetical protein
MVPLHEYVRTTPDRPLSPPLRNNVCQYLLGPGKVKYNVPYKENTVQKYMYLLCKRHTVIGTNCTKHCSPQGRVHIPRPAANYRDAREPHAGSVATLPGTKKYIYLWYKKTSVLYPGIRSTDTRMPTILIGTADSVMLTCTTNCH